MNSSHINKHALYLLFTIPFLLIFSACVGSPEETLERIAQETRSTSPQVIDEYTTMTNCEVLPNRTLKFSYNVKGVFTEIQKIGMEEAMKKVLVLRLKERKELEFYLVNNVRFEHIFVDENKNTMMHVQIEALDYK